MATAVPSGFKLLLRAATCGESPADPLFQLRLPLWHQLPVLTPQSMLLSLQASGSQAPALRACSSCTAWQRPAAQPLTNRCVQACVSIVHSIGEPQQQHERLQACIPTPSRLSLLCCSCCPLPAAELAPRQHISQQQCTGEEAAAAAAAGIHAASSTCSRQPAAAAAGTGGSGTAVGATLPAQPHAGLLQCPFVQGADAEAQCAVSAAAAASERHRAVCQCQRPAGQEICELD